MHNFICIIVVFFTINGFATDFSNKTIESSPQLHSACRNKRVIIPKSQGIKLYFDDPITKTKCFMRKSNYTNEISFLSISQNNKQLVFKGDFDITDKQDLLDYYFNSPNYSIKSFSGSANKDLHITLDVINEEYAILTTWSKTFFASLFSIEKNDTEDKLLLENSYNLILSKKSNNNNYFSMRLHKDMAYIYFGDTLFRIPKNNTNSKDRMSFTPKGDKHDLERLVNQLSENLNKIDGVESNYAKKWIYGNGFLSIDTNRKVKTNNKDRLLHWLRRYLKKYNITLHKNKHLRFSTDIAAYRVMDHYNDKGDLIW